MPKNYKLDDFIQCNHCGMKFRIRLPLKQQGPTAAEWTICTEPTCDRRFWSAKTHPKRENGYGAPKDSIVCGIDPKDYKVF